MSVMKTMTAHRTAAVSTAAILLAAISLLNLALPVLVTAGGPPLAIVVAAVVLGIVGLAAAAGLWRCKRWAAWAAIIVSILNGLSSAPGVLVAPNTALFISAVVSVVGSVVIIVLALLPSSRRAYS
jgi:hypothetical protein